ncbi:hypothetical protein CAEBREN_10528 [Caenorhabditis brenneri]|uniref:RING-type domain-containing protein n=1 Tax=Caenorhabditis brenneri TaxID=135651 RepID=G0MCY7_CAEBE|nr:hypothetical protein CAEBREN_10528 [Caenorhabditis brenneri]
MSEREQNVLSEYYVKPYKKKPKDEVLSVVQEELRKYTHDDAIKFAEMSLNCKVISFTKFSVLPKNNKYKIETYRSVPGIRAYYRVVAEKPNRYILSACHANIHGYHRGDLRFLEVNHHTMSPDDTDRHSVIGKLYLGDIMAVTGLASLREFESLDSRDVSPESDPIWMATRIYVLGRDIRRNVTFSLLNPVDQTAVVKDHNELMSINLDGLQSDVLYYGDAFFPEKIRDFFTDDHHPDHRNRLINKCSKIHQPPNPYGTIFAVYTSKALTEVSEIGQTTFKQPSVHGNEASKIVESCVLMGYSAANTSKAAILVANLRLQKELEDAKEAVEAMKAEKEKMKNEMEKVQEKEWNICEICLLPYEQGVADRTPKILDCGHTFCQECAGRMACNGSIICGQCRASTNSSADKLKTNFSIYKHV